MAEFVFRLPDVGEGIAEVELVKWHVKIGDTVREGQPLADVMTDKATVELSSPVSGVVQATRGDEGGKLRVGAELTVFDVRDGTARDKEPPISTAPSALPAHPPPSRPTAKSAANKVLAAPAVRARAKALGVDLATLNGSGPDGRIEHADLDQFLKSAAPTPAAAAIAPSEPGSEDIKIFGLRRRIAERMLESKRRIPHFTYVEEVDVTALDAQRQAMNTENDRLPHLTVLPFVIRAIVHAAAGHPAVNSHFDDTAGIVRRFKAVHIGVATQTERGLLVPVIRHAEALDLRQIAAEIIRLTREARAGKSKPAELTGSTITVTSLGPLGGIMATPIINPPEVAVIGVNRIVERPVVSNGEIAIRKMMNLSSSFDHRIIDGYAAAAFIAAIRNVLEHPLGPPR